MYRRPKFLEVLPRDSRRQIVARKWDYDVDLFAEMVRSGVQRRMDQSESFAGSQDARQPR